MVKMHKVQNERLRTVFFDRKHKYGTYNLAWYACLILLALPEMPDGKWEKGEGEKMFIRNMSSFNFAHRNTLINTNKMAKALQRLSSGYRINSAADDPAGLAMAQRMRAQITAGRTAVTNTKNTLDMTNVAEGALTEVNTMVNRLLELAEQSATGTVTDDQRATMQKEVDQIIDEIKRTSNATRFAGISLLDGSEGTKANHQIGPSS